MRPPVHPYGTRSRLLHWGSVALVVVLFIYSGQFIDTPTAEADERRMLHSSYGMLLLALMVVRIWWRTRTADPLDSYTLPNLQKFFARCVHYSLYTLLLVQCILGVLILVLGDGGSFFGLLDLPSLTDASSDLDEALMPAHAALAKAMLVLIGAHVLAAIGHLIFGVTEAAR